MGVALTNRRRFQKLEEALQKRGGVFKTLKGVLQKIGGVFKHWEGL